MQGASRWITRAFTGAVLITALILLTSPAFSECGEGDSDCPLVPPISQEVSSSEARGSLESLDAESGTTLLPLHLEMPFQAASSLSTQYDLGQDNAGPLLALMALLDVP